MLSERWTTNRAEGAWVGAACREEILDNLVKDEYFYTILL